MATGDGRLIAIEEVGVAVSASDQAVVDVVVEFSGVGDLA